MKGSPRSILRCARNRQPRIVPPSSGYSVPACASTSPGTRMGLVRCKASSALPQFPEVVRETIKETILSEVSRDDARLWKKELNTTMNSTGSHDKHNNSANLVNQTTVLTGCDPLNDLNISTGTRYWPNLPDGVSKAADPVALTATELGRLSASIRNDLIGTDHPVLNQAASYFFESSADGGKKVRPMMVVLLSRALAESVVEPTTASSMPSQQCLFTEPASWQRPDLPAAQRRLAEISEMIHTASLFHDDVIDGADTRRGVSAVHTVFGNKMAILAGDYLLARASICLARLRHVETIETMSTIIEHLVRGEVMQLRSTGEESSEQLQYYLRKNFYKTGSLMANSCKSAALLGEYPCEMVDASYRYGKHVGMAFQLVDDVLDFEGSLSQLGKPALSDLKAGLATAPVLFAAEEYPDLNILIDRKFKEEGDVQCAVDFVFASSAMDRTKELARVHAEYAMDAVQELDPSEHRDALVRLAHKVVARTH